MANVFKCDMCGACDVKHSVTVIYRQPPPSLSEDSWDVCLDCSIAIERARVQCVDRRLKREADANQETPDATT